MTEKNTDLAVQETFTNSAEFGIISQRDFFDHDISNVENIGGYYVVREEDFVYNPRISTTAPVGPVNRNKLGRNGVMSPLYTVFRTHDVDTTYLEWFFKSNYWHSFMYFNGDSGARSDRFSIKDAVFFEMPIPLPSPEEQHRIGILLDGIDDLITLHQRQRKNSMRNCSCLPFSWEQRKLSELAEIVGGGTPDTNNSAYWDGDIDWYAPAEMEGQRYAVSSVRKITELGLQKSSAKMLPAHRTVLFTSRAGIGKMAILQRPAATNQGFQSLVLRDGIDPYFIYSMGDKIKGIAEGVASGSTFLEISGKMLGSLEVMTPSIEEQKEIASFFRGIDDLITLHQRKLEKLKNIKKSMLEKMFV